MKISDELRTWALRRFGDQAAPREELDIVADRIDSEMVELPQSADGKTWTGREVCFWTGAAEGDWHKFHSLTYTDGRWCVEDKNWQRYPAESVWYERPDSWERIADELEKWCDSTDADGDACDVPRCIADRIRRLAERTSGDRGTHAQMTRRDRSDATTSAATPRTAPTGRQCSTRLICGTGGDGDEDTD